MERLTFNAGRSFAQPIVAGRARRLKSSPPPASAAAAPARERYDWDYLWLFAFTTVLFFRPQDQVPGVELLHLAELTAIFGLAAMAVRRLRAGLPIAHVNPEVLGVVALGVVVLGSVPFSIWPGGSEHVFTDIYVKIILIFALMMSTLREGSLRSPLTLVALHDTLSGTLAKSGAVFRMPGVPAWAVPVSPTLSPAAVRRTAAREMNCFIANLRCLLGRPSGDCGELVGLSWPAKWLYVTACTPLHLITVSYF